MTHYEENNTLTITIVTEYSTIKNINHYKKKTILTNGHSYSSWLMLAVDIAMFKAKVLKSKSCGRREEEKLRKKMKTLCRGRVQCTRLSHTPNQADRSPQTLGLYSVIQFSTSGLPTADHITFRSRQHHTGFVCKYIQ